MPLQPEARSAKNRGNNIGPDRPVGTAPSPRGAGLAMLVCGSVLISFSPVLVRLAGAGPETTGFYRTFVGGTGLLLLALVRGWPGLGGARTMTLGVGAALFFALDLTFWHRAIFELGPGMATILGNCQVFVLACWGVFVLGEGGAVRLAVSVAMAAVGIALLYGLGRTEMAGSAVGLLYGLLTAVFYAGFILMMRKMQTGERGMAQVRNMAVMSLLTAAIMGSQSFAMGDSVLVADHGSLAWLIAYGVVAQLLGWMFISRGLPLVAVSTAGLIILLQPSLAFIWDVLVFGRPAGALDMAGAGLTFVAIYLGATRKASRS